MKSHHASILGFIIAFITVNVSSSHRLEEQSSLRGLKNYYDDSNDDLDDAYGSSYGYDDDYYLSDDAIDNGSSSNYTNNTWIQKAIQYEQNAEEQFWQLYSNPPSDWTANQWGFFSGFMTFSVAMLLCLCVSCTCCCGKKETEPQEQYNNEFGYSDYTSVNKPKSKTNPVYESDDDDTTYDSIMRLRSDG